MALRELPPQNSVNKPRDADPLEVVSSETWHCRFCAQPGGEGVGTTVEWIGDYGRCRECGKKYLAEED
jgi:hypothetical protein